MRLQSAAVVNINGLRRLQKLPEFTPGRSPQGAKPGLRQRSETADGAMLE
jgi:hypothetical protein